MAAGWDLVMPCRTYPILTLNRFLIQLFPKFALSLQINVIQWFPIATDILQSHRLQFNKNRNCRILHGHFYFVKTFRIKVKSKYFWEFYFINLEWKNRIGKGPSSKIHSKLHPRDVKTTSTHRPHFCLSPPPFPPNQGRLESNENQGNGLRISCSWNFPDWTFTSKETSEKRGHDRPTHHKNFEAQVFGCEAANWGEESEGCCWQRR